MSADPAMAEADAALDEHAEAARAAPVEDGETTGALALQAARDALATWRQARAHGCRSVDPRALRGPARRRWLSPTDLLTRVERRARLAVAALEEGPDRAELEEELARLQGRERPTRTRTESGGDARPQETCAAANEEASMANEDEDEASTTATAEQPASDAKRKRTAPRAKAARVRCTRCRTRVYDAPTALARHARVCSPSRTRAPTTPNAPATRTSAATTPEEALARCREALAPFEPAVRKLALDLLAATMA